MKPNNYQEDAFVQQFVQKCQYYYALSNQSIPMVTVRSNVSLLIALRQNSFGCTSKCELFLAAGNPFEGL